MQSLIIIIKIINIEKRKMPDTMQVVVDHAIHKFLSNSDMKSAAEECFNKGLYAEAYYLAEASKNRKLLEDFNVKMAGLADPNPIITLYKQTEVTRQLLTHISCCDANLPNQWKEVLVKIATESDDQQFGMLCEKLGKKLESHPIGDKSRAVFCYVLSANEQAVMGLLQCKNPQMDSFGRFSEQYSLLSKTANHVGQYNNGNSWLTQQLFYYHQKIQGQQESERLDATTSAIKELVRSVFGAKPAPATPAPEPTYQPVAPVTNIGNAQWQTSSDDAVPSNPTPVQQQSYASQAPPQFYASQAPSQSYPSRHQMPSTKQFQPDITDSRPPSISIPQTPPVLERNQATPYQHSTYPPMQGAPVTQHGSANTWQQQHNQSHYFNGSG